MPKLKTTKSVSSRIRVTKNKKYMRKRGGQSHYNARESGKTGRNKKRDFSIAKTEHRTLKSLLPYS
jgi:ribosomal protein L35